jgi:hypothetical protein
LIIAQRFAVQSQFLEAGTSEIEHLGSGFALKQVNDLVSFKSVFEKITIIYLDILLRKKLLRLATGISLNPTIEINLCNHYPILLFQILVTIDLQVL